MAFVLLGMARRALRNEDHHHNDQYCNNGPYYNNGQYFNNPTPNNATYPPSTYYQNDPYHGLNQFGGRGARKMEKKMRKAERLAHRADRIATRAGGMAERRGGLAVANPPPPPPPPAATQQPAPYAPYAPYARYGDERPVVYPPAPQGAAQEYYSQAREGPRGVYTNAGPAAVRGTVSQVSLPLDEPPAYEQAVGMSSSRGSGKA